MKDRIIELLGNGISPAVAASAVGCSESYVSQLMSDPLIAEDVANRRFANLQAHNTRDKRIDKLEDQLLDKLDQAIPMMIRPMEIMKAFTLVNAAKRRGSSAPEQVHVTNQIVQLTLPQNTAVRFKMSSAREIIEVEGQSLITMPSNQLLLEAKQHATNKLYGETLSGTTDKQAA
jgi:hypothetical protein